MTEDELRDRVSAAVCEGVDLVIGDPGIGMTDGEMVDAGNLIVNAILTCWDQPGVSLNEVMDRCYDGGHDEVRSWHDWT